MRSARANYNIVAVSANNAETALNTEQALDTSMLCSVNDICNLEPRRENNADEMTGKEEPDTVYDNGQTTSMTMNFEKAQPQHFAFLYAYGLGIVSTAAESAGYRHTITPISGDLASDHSQAGFTVAQRYGQTIGKRRFASMFVNSLTATFAKDEWVKISSELVGTGKHTDSVVEESISALPDATSLTLAANAVEGADAATRLDNVQRIRVELSDGVWTDVDYSAVSDAAPAIITISAPGTGVDAVTYKVLYTPAESGWMTLPSRVSESPLRVAEIALTFGGTWDGSAFQGGKTMSAEINSIEHNLANDMLIEFVPGAGDTYAARAFRNGRTQTVKLDREFRDFIMQQHISDNDTFGMQIVCTGAEFATGENFEVKIVFPRLGVLTAPVSTNDKRLAEAGDLQVLEDDTHGSVIVEVLNQVATYAA